MKIIKESKWQLAKNLKGQDIKVKTIHHQAKNGKVYTSRKSIKLSQLAI